MKPVSLYPATETPKSNKMDIFLSKYGDICLVLLVILLIIMLIMLLGAVFDMFSIGSIGNGVSMTESGQFYYHLKDVI